jgi:hypothetical protein
MADVKEAAKAAEAAALALTQAGTAEKPGSTQANPPPTASHST